MSWTEEIRERFPTWNTAAAREQWPLVQQQRSVGQSVRGEVVARAPFGVWVDMGVGLPALLRVPEMARARERPIAFEEYPALATIIDARILWLGEGAEIVLTQLPVEQAN